MNRLLQFTGALALACCASTAIAQLSPEITGDNMLCPNGSGTLTTDTYDSYQWYRRYFGSNDTVELTGETSQTLTVTYADFAPSYLIVEVTDDGETAMSPEFLVDGWAFLPATVMTSGEFETGNNGEAIICEGDTLYLEMMSPNTNDVTWYDGGNPIPGQTNVVLEVTEAGSYTASGSPAECPDFVQFMNIPIEVIVENCGTTGIGENGLPHADIYPNPASSELTIAHTSERIANIRLHDARGQFVQEISVNDLSVTIPVAQLQKGIYFVTVNYDAGSEVRPVAIR